jgi:hypothetical protein
MSTPLIRFFAAAGLFALWSALVFMGMAPAASLILGIQAALVGLGVFHVASTATPSAPQPQIQPEKTT